MIIKLKCTNIEATDPIKIYAEEKLGELDKFFDNIQFVDIDIGMTTHHHKKGKVYYAECNVSVPGKLLRVVKESDDLYKAIDKVKDHYKDLLEQMQGKMKRKDKEMLRETKSYPVEE